MLTYEQQRALLAQALAALSDARDEAEAGYMDEDSPDTGGDLTLTAQQHFDSIVTLVDNAIAALHSAGVEPKEGL